MLQNKIKIGQAMWQMKSMCMMWFVRWNCKVLKHLANVGKVLKTKKEQNFAKSLEKIVITMIY